MIKLSKRDNNSTLKVLAIIAISLAFYLLSVRFFTPLESSLIATIVALVALYSSEIIAIGVVSLLPIILFPMLGILDIKSTTQNYANPIIYLFLGGFFIAIAVEKLSIHKYLATKLLAKFATSTKSTILTLMSLSALLSSLLSNTTTALLLMPLALFLSKERAIKARLALAVAYGASIGGILTPIGTPPNLILLGFMNQKLGYSIAFIEWMAMMAPLVIIMIIFCSYLLSIGVSEIKLERFEKSEQKLNKSQKTLLYLMGSLITILLINARIEPYWSGLGLDETIVILSFGILLFLLGILQWSEDIKKVPFEIMFVFGAGFAIANAFSATGLDIKLSSYLSSISTLNIFIIIAMIALITTFATEITSNTALISIMLPIIYALSLSQEPLYLMIVATISASFAFMLPIATPPNAIAMSSRATTVSQMIRFGLVLNIVGAIAISILAYFYWSLFF